MKKCVASVLAGISMMNCIPSASAMHFESSVEKSSKSQSKKIDLKSAILGGIVGGVASAPVVALVSGLIGGLIGKKVIESSNDSSGVIKNEFTESNIKENNYNNIEYSDVLNFEWERPNYENVLSLEDLNVKNKRIERVTESMIESLDNGYGDGYDLNVDDVFQIKKFSLSLDNLASNNCQFVERLFIPKLQTKCDAFMFITDCDSSIAGSPIEGYLFKKDDLNHWTVENHYMVPFGNSIDKNEMYLSAFINLFSNSKDLLVKCVGFNKLPAD